MFSLVVAREERFSVVGEGKAVRNDRRDVDLMRPDQFEIPLDRVQAPAGWLLFHDLLDWLHLQLWLWLP